MVAIVILVERHRIWFHYVYVHNLIMVIDVNKIHWVRNNGYIPIVSIGWQRNFHYLLVDSLCPYNPCKNGGTCYPLGYGNNQQLLCICPPNYRGERCEDIENGWEELLLADVWIWGKELVFVHFQKLHVLIILVKMVALAIVTDMVKIKNYIVFVQRITMVNNVKKWKKVKKTREILRSLYSRYFPSISLLVIN